MPKFKTIEQLMQEVSAKQKLVAKLAKKKTALLGKLDAVERKIRMVTGETLKAGVGVAKRVLRRGRRGRKGRKSLAATLMQVLQKAPAAGMRAKEIAKAALDAGYKTAAKNFYGMVAAALRDKAKFRRLRRGVYSLK